jgi:hypothetical protein
MRWPRRRHSDIYDPAEEAIVATERSTQPICNRRNRWYLQSKAPAGKSSTVVLGLLANWRHRYGTFPSSHAEMGRFAIVEILVQGLTPLQCPDIEALEKIAIMAFAAPI